MHSTRVEAKKGDTKQLSRSKSPRNLPRPVSPNSRIDIISRPRAVLPSKSPTRQRKAKPRHDTAYVSPSRSKEVKEMKHLPPTSVNSAERQLRPSFQGLSIIENVKSNKTQTSSISAADQESRKEDRRKHSLKVMRSSATSDTIKEIFSSVVDDVNAMALEGTGEQRLQAVMTKAKEEGMTTEDIFNFFNGGNPNTISISHETFLAALHQLSNTFVVIKNEELVALVRKFDKNDDGSISIAEFKNYCYTEIPSVAWKAERTRLENSGEMKKLTAEVSRRFIPTEKPECYDCGEEVFRTSKFFWRNNDNLDIKLHFSASLDVITMQLYSETNEKELPNLYICKHKVDDQLKGESKGSPTSTSMSTSTPTVESEEWEAIAKYLVARLKLKECHGEISEEGTDTEEDPIPKLECSHMSKEASCIPFLCKLTGDTFDTLMIRKPLNLESPPPMTKTMGEFEEAVASFQRASRNARTSRKSAQELTSLVSSALSEVQEMIAEEEGS